MIAGALAVMLRANFKTFVGMYVLANSDSKGERMSGEREQEKSSEPNPSPNLDAAERKEIREDTLRRYEARMKLLTIVLGTMVVGLAGVLVPGVINYASLVFDRHKAYG